MMPIIRPLPKQCQPQTEYQNERLIFAKMKVALQRRKRRQRMKHIKVVIRSLGHIFPRGAKKSCEA